MNAAVIAFGEKGYALGERLLSYFEQNGDAARLARCGQGELAAWTKRHFAHDALIFIGSCGIAVRAVAPFLESKTRDPAVVVIDERAGFAVSLLSGHIGGANDLTLRLARFLGAIPVVTAATDVHGLFAIDAWAARSGLGIANPERIKCVSARLLAGESIGIQSAFPVRGRPPEGTRLCDADEDVRISCRTDGRPEALHLVPPVVTLGIGCKKGVGAEAIERAFELTLKRSSCHPLAVARVCSIDLKAREPGILEFCGRRALPYKTFSARELTALRGPYAASAFVKQVTGADNVCERSAVLGSGEGGQLLAGKNAGCGVAMALAVSPYVVSFDKENQI
jgi:cobalt-precorrin 5A hydrolase